MNQPIATVLLLGMLLLLILAPFSALSLLMLLAVGSILFWMGWTIIRALFSSSSASDSHPSRDL